MDGILRQDAPDQEAAIHLTYLNMAETANISEIAAKISEDIFQYFHWNIHPLRDQNFPCLNEAHKTLSGGEKKSHPADVVFYYDDPYLGQKIYLHTDLKSYGKGTIKRGTIKSALASLAMTVDCATVSESWRTKYLLDEAEPYEIRGLLFVYNHDKQFTHDFNETLQKTDLTDLPIRSGTYLHVLGTRDINHLYTISNDLIRLLQKQEISKEYSFYYPDMILWKRRGDVWGAARHHRNLNCAVLRY